MVHICARSTPQCGGNKTFVVHRVALKSTSRHLTTVDFRNCEMFSARILSETRSAKHAQVTPHYAKTRFKIARDSRLKTVLSPKEPPPSTPTTIPHPHFQSIATRTSTPPLWVGNLVGNSDARYWAIQGQKHATLMLQTCGPRSFTPPPRRNRGGR